MTSIQSWEPIQEHQSLESFLSKKIKAMGPVLRYTPTLKVLPCSLSGFFVEISTIKPQKVTNSFSSVLGLMSQYVSCSPPNPCPLPLPRIHLLCTLSRNPLSQISIDSDGHSSSLPQKSEPH